MVQEINLSAKAPSFAATAHDPYFNMSEKQPAKRLDDSIANHSILRLKTDKQFQTTAGRKLTWEDQKPRPSSHNRSVVNIAYPKVVFEDIYEDEERVTMFNQAEDDALFREHLDDQYFNNNPSTITSANYTKKLVCEYLQSLI